MARIGDIYAVETSAGQVKLFHHVANDASQLGSNVIRAYRSAYSAASLPHVLELLKAEVDFHAHAVCSFGIKLGYWQKVAHVKPATEVTVWFRDSTDYGNPSIKISKDWWVWKVNQPSKHIGQLRGEYVGAEIGIVFNPAAIVSRVLTGSFGIVYPAYE
jgi:hypothetical protein